MLQNISQSKIKFYESQIDSSEMKAIIKHYFKSEDFKKFIYNTFKNIISKNLLLSDKNEKNIKAKTHSDNDWETQPRRPNGQFTFRRKTGIFRKNVVLKKDEQEKKELISELDANGIKYTKENILFITKDKSNQIIWLEKGNDFAGLQHILKRHEMDFSKAFGVSKEELSSFLKNIISNGNIISSRIKKNNGKDCLEKIYEINGKYVLLTGIGTNVFLVSAYPISL